MPFCTRKCAYCDFYSVARTALIDAYIDAVGTEYAARHTELGTTSIATLYFGGGTPSLLSPDRFSRLAARFKTNSVEEFTIEINPDDVDYARIDAWLAAGVNRVSIGVQSLVDSELAAVGRRHDARQALHAISSLQEAGISNISADLIYGLPGQTVDTFAHSIDTLLATGITHLSAYCLSYEEGTALWQRRQRGLVAETDDNTIAAMYALLCERTRLAGFEHYEISNFALPGYRSRHNSSYWTGTPYLGLGPGAHSLDSRGTRRYVPSDLKAYISSPATAAIVDDESELDRANDRIVTSLRTAAGLGLNTFSPHHQAQLRRAAATYIDRGMLVATPSGFAIPEKSWLLSDAIIRDLLL